MPPKVKMRRYRFIKTAGETITLNVDLVTKAERLEGIKGYITNTPLPDAWLLSVTMICGELNMPFG